MIEIGDFVREAGGSQDFMAVGYSSAKDQFEIRSVNGPIQIKRVDRNSLELVKKAPGNDLGGPGLKPERWITD